MLCIAVPPGCTAQTNAIKFKKAVLLYEVNFVCNVEKIYNQSINDIIMIIKLYCHFQHALHVNLECSLALTHIVTIHTNNLNMATKYIIYSVHNMFFRMIKIYYFDIINK